MTGIVSYNSNKIEIFTDDVTSKWNIVSSFGAGMFNRS